MHVRNYAQMYVFIAMTDDNDDLLIYVQGSRISGKTQGQKTFGTLPAAIHNLGAFHK